MKFFLLFTFLFAFSLANAQKNIFNVPTAELQEAGATMLQTDLIFSDEVQQQFIFSHGFHKNLEAGLTLYDINLHSKKGFFGDPFETETNPDALINLKSGLDLNSNFKIALGTVSGLNFKSKSSSDLSNFSYSLFQFAKDEKLKLDAGAWYANEVFLAAAEQIGFMAALQIELINDKLILSSDFISGNHSRGFTTFGLDYSLSEIMKIAPAVQIPNPQRKEDLSYLVQITFDLDKSENK